LTLAEAHTSSEQLERAICEELGGATIVAVHLEPRRDQVQPAVRYAPLNAEIQRLLAQLPNASAVAQVETLLTDAGTFVPPAVLSLAARATVDVLSRTRPPVNLVISNVPGPREPLYLAGARLEHNYPISVVLDGVGMNITVMSYRDGIDIGIVADREQVSECASVVAGIEAGLDDLER